MFSQSDIVGINYMATVLIIHITQIIHGDVTTISILPILIRLMGYGNHG